MAEVLFYHLTATPLEQALPEILEKSLARGWRVLVRCGSDAGMAALDAALWTWRDEAFLPHGTAAAGHPEHQSVYLTVGDDCPNGAAMLVLADGGRALPEEMARFERTCVFFDGGDAGALEVARADWRRVRAAGLAARYWAQEHGRWTQKSAS